MHDIWKSGEVDNTRSGEDPLANQHRIPKQETTKDEEKPLTFRAGPSLQPDFEDLRDSFKSSAQPTELSSTNPLHGGATKKPSSSSSPSHYAATDI